MWQIRGKLCRLGVMSGLFRRSQDVLFRTLARPRTKQTLVWIQFPVGAQPHDVHLRDKAKQPALARDEDAANVAVHSREQSLGDSNERFNCNVLVTAAHFLTLNLNVVWRFDTDADSPPRDAHDRNDDVITDEQTLVLPSR